MAYGAAAGLRNLWLAVILAASAVAAEPVTVAALGDSLTHGYGLAQQDGFVAQLQRWLQAQGVDAVVLNAGVSGDTTHGGLARVGWTLTPDVDAMIVALGSNDMLRGIEPASVRVNLVGILRAADEAGIEVLLAGVSAMGNYGPDYKREFDAIYPDLAAEFDVIFVPDFTGPVSAELAGGRPMEELLQADRLHPNAAGVALMVEAIGPRVVELVGRAAP